MKTQPLEDIVCPKCHKRGQLKLQDRKYYRVDHYKFKNGFRHGKWIYSCYLGKVIENG